MSDVPLSIPDGAAMLTVDEEGETTIFVTSDKGSGGSGTDS
jgi:hypothetical protein